eukprot:TRINITY_DN1750_c0_g2_i4.p1 TRINITY_DN1750_c0_g2~~TRINITY_DN1750_c0_g2_i4.p1  ORF type:complete len:538 (+),score=172.93 TRINITY_DN1750_c0_g2_i4:92-1705(+)
MESHTGGGKITKRRKSDPNKQERKFFRRCNECVNCKRVECGICKHCLDMPKFGGSYKLKKACVDRECVRSKQDHSALSSAGAGGARNGSGGTNNARGANKGSAAANRQVNRIHQHQAAMDNSIRGANNNKGKYYIIPNGSGEIYQLQSFATTNSQPPPGHVTFTAAANGQMTAATNGHVTFSAATAAAANPPGHLVTSSGVTGMSPTILQSLAPNTNIAKLAPGNNKLQVVDMKPKPSSIGLAYSNGGKPAQKVYTCTLAAANHQQHVATPILAAAAAKQQQQQTAALNAKSGSTVLLQPAAASYNGTTAAAASATQYNGTTQLARRGGAALNTLKATPTVNVAVANKRRREEEEREQKEDKDDFMAVDGEESRRDGVGGSYGAPTTPTDVEQAANNVDIDDFVNKYLKVYYEDPTSGAMDYLEENLEEFGLEVIADIKFHPSGGGCESFWGEASSTSSTSGWDSASSDSGDTRWKDYDDTDLELGLSKLLEYEEEPYPGMEPYNNLAYRGFCQFCTLNSKCVNCHLNTAPRQIGIN